jgi:uncharacterized HAD superfamily protein
MSRNNEFELQKPMHKRRDAVVFDLDGTLAETMTFEKHHKGKNGKNENFANEAREVETRDKIVKKLREFKDEGEAVVILTARSAHYRSETKAWLHKNNIPYDALIMRPTDDTKQKDKSLKRELLEEDILPKFDVKKAYDDKKKNRKMFEKLGIDAKYVKEK